MCKCVCVGRKVCIPEFKMKFECVSMCVRVFVGKKKLYYSIYDEVSVCVCMSVCLYMGRRND